MGIAERKHRDREARRKRILEVALKIFHEEGFEHLSMRAIAGKIEYSATTLYRDFKNKDDIIFALHSEGFGILIERELRVQSIEDPLDRLLAHGREYVDFALENPEYYDLMVINRSVARRFAETQIWREGGKSFTLLKRNVRDCMAEGYFHGEDLDGATFAMWASVHGIASLIIRSRVTMLPPEFLQSMVEGALHAFGTMVRATKRPHIYPEIL